MHACTPSSWLFFAVETGINLASNPGPHHFNLLDLREEGLGKLPAILEIVRSMDRFDRSFHRFSL